MQPVEVFERADLKWDWRLLGSNGEQMCGSVQGYRDPHDAKEGFLRCAAAMLEGGWEFREITRDG